MIALRDLCNVFADSSCCSSKLFSILENSVNKAYNRECWNFLTSCTVEVFMQRLQFLFLVVFLSLTFSSVSAAQSCPTANKCDQKSGENWICQEGATIEYDLSLLQGGCSPAACVAVKGGSKCYIDYLQFPPILDQTKSTPGYLCSAGEKSKWECNDSNKTCTCLAG